MLNSDFLKYVNFFMIFKMFVKYLQKFCRFFFKKSKYAKYLQISLEFLKKITFLKKIFRLFLIGKFTADLILARNI